jgi:PPK2 family polyphosphate:nucleotide phosphotransferase
MGIDLSNLKVANRKDFNLDDFDTTQKGGLDKEKALESLNDLKAELFILQEKLYASNNQSLLIIFQAMDGGGKDSAIKHVMSGLNPQGVHVYSFKQPSKEEIDHDFLWRHYKALPSRGSIHIHNRSHYENVLICKVHPELAAFESRTPLNKIDKSFWDTRYESIRNFEEHMAKNGTTVLKFFLHISKDEQKERFLERIDDPSKNWKFSSADLKERELWQKYMSAYEDAFKKTGTESSPWYIVPADKKWFAHLAVCQIIVDRMKSMNIQIPELTHEDKLSLADSKAKLLEE